MIREQFAFSLTFLLVSSFCFFYHLYLKPRYYRCLMSQQGVINILNSIWGVLTHSYSCPPYFW